MPLKKNGNAKWEIQKVRSGRFNLDKQVEQGGPPSGRISQICERRSDLEFFSRVFLCGPGARLSYSDLRVTTNGPRARLFPVRAPSHNMGHHQAANLHLARRVLSTSYLRLWVWFLGFVNYRFLKSAKIWGTKRPPGFVTLMPSQPFHMEPEAS